MPSVGAHLGVPGYPADLVGLRDSKRYVVVLIDGLGWEAAVRAGGDAPYLAAAIGGAHRAVVPSPSTTAASLMSLWTGVEPGSHGVVGFSFALPEGTGSPVVRPLTRTRPLGTAPSVPDRLVADGVAVTFALPGEQVGSGFTQMGTRHAGVIEVGRGRDPEGDAVASIVRAVRRGDRAVVYAYDARLDQAGHRYGVKSAAWREALTGVDAFLSRLRAGLDDGVCLVVTGDHGMVDVAADARLVIDSDPDLAKDVRLVGGEARFRHLYTSAPGAVCDRWRGRLGDEAVVLTRSQVEETGLLGPVDPGYRSRIGDVVVVPRGGQAYLTASFRAEYRLIGMHGAATAAERYVPILVG